MARLYKVRWVKTSGDAGEVTFDHPADAFQVVSSLLNSGSTQKCSVHDDLGDCLVHAEHVGGTWVFRTVAGGA